MPKPFKITLSNGLRVILLENHTSPVVSINLWANVGSVNETDQEAGLCHLIEHMLFKGTSRRPVGRIAQEVEAAGGDMNAYTSFDETVFYINMTAKGLDVGLDVLADAACDPTFDEAELTREKEVVVEEISRAEDNPSQMVSQDLFSKAFTVHPYRRPIAGDRETVRGVSREHLLEFYKRWYVGSNLILIVVGDFQKEKILPKIEGLFSKIPGGNPPAQTITTEPPPEGQRIVTRAMSIEGRYLDLAVPIPNLTHPDVPALDLLAHILGGGDSSRLEQEVKEKKGLVSSIGSYPYTPRHPCLFIVGAVLKEKALAKTLPAVWEEVERLKEEPPTTVECARARENIRSARVYERQTVEAMARKLAHFEGIANDLGFEDEYYRRISEVTPEEIRGVAQKYLCPERITLSFCHPKGEAWPAERIKGWLKPGGRSRPRTSRPDTELFRLRSGVRLLVRENRNLPLIAIRSISLGGTRLEPRRLNGALHLLATLLTKGTTHRTAREIAEETENISGHIDGYSNRNLTGLYGSFLSEKLTEGIGLFCDLLLNPGFPDQEIVKEKGHTCTAIRNEEDSLTSVVMKKFLAALYGRHPYALPTLGTLATVRSIKRGDLVRLHQGLLHPHNLVISVVGDVDPKGMKERFEEKLDSWRSTGRQLSFPHLPSPPKLEPLRKPVEVVTHRKKLQAHIVYGFLGTTVRSPDRYPLEVLNFILAGQGGRLFLELRDKQGLAYAISSSTNEGIEPGTFAVYMGCDPKKLERATAGIYGELKKITGSTVSEEELERAKRFIIGGYQLDLQRNESVASLLACHEIFGIGRDELTRYPEKIEQVSAGEVLRVAKKYLRPEASVLSIVRNV